MIVPEFGASFSPQQSVTYEQQVSDWPQERRTVRLSHLLCEVDLSFGVALLQYLQRNIRQLTCTRVIAPYALTHEGLPFCV